MARIGGTLFVAANGTRIAVRGAWSLGGFGPKREMIPGADGIHGHKEMPQVPYIEGEASFTPDLDLPALLKLEGATITAELANGKVGVLRDAVQAAEGVLNTEEGSVPLRFEGTSLDLT